jgi:hypothetical protein
MAQYMEIPMIVMGGFDSSYRVFLEGCVMMRDGNLIHLEFTLDFPRFLHPPMEAIHDLMESYSFNNGLIVLVLRQVPFKARMMIQSNESLTNRFANRVVITLPQIMNLFDQSSEFVKCSIIFDQCTDEDEDENVFTHNY